MTATAEMPVRTSEAGPTPVDFWFDPACPWAWLTSRWILNVEQVRPIDTTFRVMSLAYLNEDKDLSDEVVQMLMGPVRVVQAVVEDHGDAAARLLYTEMGNRRHLEQRRLTPDVLPEAVVAAGFDAAYAEAYASREYDEAIRRSHDAGLDLVGPDVGTPIIRAGGEAFFGPIVSKAPVGEDAGKLWDGFRAVMSIPGFYEIKKTRDTQPDFD